MEQKNQTPRKRTFIVINYTFLVLTLVFFYLGKNTNWPLTISGLEIIFLALSIFSFRRAFITTGYWRLVHSSKKSLDEREMKVVLNAIKNSYVVFTIVTLLIIYGLALAGQVYLDVVIAAGLLYLAHTLPAAIAGWHENNFVMEYE
ncbi:MAG: hypothetical protein JXL67_12950 [Calditrichaeota bacterium]|nr:hypothetical protein [Calditrichota bacterium]